MTTINKDFEATVKEFVERLTTIENEMTILRQDRSELFADMKEKLDPRSFRAAIKIHNLQKSTPDQTSLARILEVLEASAQLLYYGVTKPAKPHQLCVAFYKGEGGWHNRIVRWTTQSKYSHAELIMPDNTCISITPFGQAGIRRKEFKEAEEDYDIICVPVSDEQLETIEKFYEDTKGDGYDWPGMILSKFTPFFIKRVGRWYCSEWIAYALRLAGAVDNLYHYPDLTPQRLHELLKKYAD